MVVFREPRHIVGERCSADRQRHRELVEESVKKNAGNIVSHESIIGQSGTKKIKIPIKGIKEYSFVYSRNVPQLATGDGNEMRGDVIGEDTVLGANAANQAGNVEGDEIYEIEITIDELADYLFDDLNLPELSDKNQYWGEAECRIRKAGYYTKGIPPRLAKKRSAVERIKRKQSYIRGFAGAADNIREERFPFSKEDLRYHRKKESARNGHNAAVICIMDVSGSMDQTKKHIARSFYFILYSFLKKRYSNIEVVFIAHTTVAKEVNEQEFFHRGESGGTFISSGYRMALEIIEERYDPEHWNVYTFHCSDGDNWLEDNNEAIRLASKLCEVCNLFGYGEIAPLNTYCGNTFKSEITEHITAKNFVAETMGDRDGIIKGLNRILRREGGGSLKNVTASDTGT